MANETTSAEVAELAEHVLAEATFVAQAESAFMPGNIGEQFLRVKDLTGRRAKLAGFPKWNELTAATQAETADITTWQQADVAETQITATIKSVPTFYTRLAAESADWDLAGDRGVQMGRAFAKKVDTDVCALAAGFTGHTAVGTTNTALTFAPIISAINKLETAEAARPYAVILHPKQWYDLLVEANSKFMEVAKFGPVANEVIRTYRTFEVLGCQWVITPRTPTANATVDWNGMVIARGAIGMVWKWLPRIDVQEDISRGGGGWEFIGKFANGVAELEDLYGCGVISKVAV